MKTKLLKPALFSALCLPVAVAIGAVLSNGAPASSTGAPDELTCAQSGCHADNAGRQAMPEMKSTLRILENGADAELIMPGRAYSLRAEVNQQGALRSGFQVLALDEHGRNAGTWKVTDKNRTQVIENYVALKDRRYATYTYPGTEAESSGQNTWEMDWTAPTLYSGSITFYAAFVAANGDGTDNGDWVQTKQLSIHGSHVSVEAPETPPSAIVMGNQLVLSAAAPGSAELFDLSGRAVWAQPYSAGTSNHTLEGHSGIFILRIGSTHQQKILLP